MKVEILTNEELITLKNRVPESHNSNISPVLNILNEDIQGVAIEEVPDYFRDIKHLNVLLTNGCNLECSYCFEQHKEDYGRWTLENLNKTYDFLRNHSKAPSKDFQFFGGEPLLKSRLIFQFLEHLRQDPSIRIKLITNGLLLSNEFLEEFLSYPNTHILISLDTIRSERDHRNLTQEQINTILSYIGTVKMNIGANDEMPMSIRCTISQETAPDFPDFVSVLYELGIRSITVHPLTMSITQGYIEWDNQVWDTLYSDISIILQNPQYEDLTLEFAEGVGNMSDGTNNCLVGNGMLAIDANGDISGCYFINNMKKDLNSLILGNIFKETNGKQGRIYTQRYKEFDSAYTKFHAENMECRECEANGLCYQCPVGNYATSGKMFRPDSMCKKIVAFHSQIKALGDLTYVNFVKKELTKYEEEVGTDNMILRVLTALTMYRFTGTKLIPELYTYIEKSIKIEGIINLIFESQIKNANGRKVYEYITYDQYLDKVTNVTTSNIFDVDSALVKLYMDVVGGLDCALSGFADMSIIDKLAVLHVVCNTKGEQTKIEYKD